MVFQTWHANQQGLQSFVTRAYVVKSSTTVAMNPPCKPPPWTRNNMQKELMKTNQLDFLIRGKKYHIHIECGV